MTSPYVTTNGLQIPAIGDASTPGTILGDLAARQRAILDPNLDCEADAPMGQMNGVFADRERNIWEALQVAWDGFDPDAAEDFLLDAVCAITGTVRGEESHGFVFVTLNIDANKTIPAGTTFANNLDTSIQFSLDADITSVGAGNYPNLRCTCTTLGRVVCNAGTLTVIQTPVTGLNAVTNPLDAVPGEERDTDPELRIRRVNELEASGAGTVDTIKAAVAAITNPDGSKPILDCKTYENTSDYISPQGIPAHSVETVIYDGPSPTVANNDVAQVIWNKKGAGISAYGNTSGTATDKEGNPQTMFFSRCGIINGAMAITVETDIARPDDYAGDAVLKEALKEEFDLRAILGVTEIRASPFVKASVNVTGILGVTNLQIGNILFSLPPAWQSFDVPFRTKILLDTSNITITRVQVVP